jgi:hypothetical protein
MVTQGGSATVDLAAGQADVEAGVSTTSLLRQLLPAALEASG